MTHNHSVDGSSPSAPTNIFNKIIDAMLKENKLKRISCASCNAFVVVSLEANGQDIQPRPGDFSICSRCKAWLVFTEDGTRIANDAEVEESRALYEKDGIEPSNLPSLQQHLNRRENIRDQKRKDTKELEQRKN